LYEERPDRSDSATVPTQRERRVDACCWVVNQSASLACSGSRDASLPGFRVDEVVRRVRSDGAANNASTHPFQRKHAAIRAIELAEAPEPDRHCSNEKKGAL